MLPAFHNHAMPIVRHTIATASMPIARNNSPPVIELKNQNVTVVDWVNPVGVGALVFVVYQTIIWIINQINPTAKIIMETIKPPLVNCASLVVFISRYNFFAPKMALQINRL